MILHQPGMCSCTNGCRTLKCTFFQCYFFGCQIPCSCSIDQGKAEEGGAPATEINDAEEGSDESPKAEEEEEPAVVDGLKVVKSQNIDRAQ